MVASLRTEAIDVSVSLLGSGPGCSTHCNRTSQVLLLRLSIGYLVAVFPGENHKALVAPFGTETVNLSVSLLGSGQAAQPLQLDLAGGCC